MSTFDDEVCFPSGECLPVVEEPDEPVVQGPHGNMQPRYYDPLDAGNPLLDTSAYHRDKQLSPNFRVGELASSGGTDFDRARIDPEFVQYLEDLRVAANLRSAANEDAGIYVNSGYRPYEYNRHEVDGSEYSAHCSGYGADVRYAGELSALEFAKTALRERPCRVRIGYVMSGGAIHVDLKSRDNPVNSWTFDEDPGMWDYDGTPEDEYQELVNLRTGTADTEGLEERFDCR